MLSCAALISSVFVSKVCQRACRKGRRCFSSLCLPPRRCPWHIKPLHHHQQQHHQCSCHVHSLLHPNLPGIRFLWLVFISFSFLSIIRDRKKEALLIVFFFLLDVLIEDSFDYFSCFCSRGFLCTDADKNNNPYFLI